MQTIEINNLELEDFIKGQYGQDSDSLLYDFMTFVRTEFVGHELKKGFDEVKLFETGKKPLSSVEEMMARLRSAN
ncbi:MAG: Unknown protein [uncultured Sulfurovum sp.]|uniref:Uncharacterized protein n=1 Tax=uncultured Sulfurovum sp. TaxID=269237 RepID=A0A6S6UA09_9BACT|nr:MAG: Unknown protein [uncultured Sulfurovum sp.]